MPRREPGERQRHAARASIAISRTGPIQPGPARIEQLLVRGSYLTEAVFFHRASRSLILADLIESFEADKVRGPWLRLAIRLGGCLHPDGVMPRDLRLTFIGRRRDLRRAVARMVDWQPRRVIIAHGRWYAEDGARELERAFCWLGPLA